MYGGKAKGGATAPVYVHASSATFINARLESMLVGRLEAQLAENESSKTTKSARPPSRGPPGGRGSPRSKVGTAAVVNRRVELARSSRKRQEEARRHRRELVVEAEQHKLEAAAERLKVEKEEASMTNERTVAEDALLRKLQMETEATIRKKRDDLEATRKRVAEWEEEKKNCQRVAEKEAKAQYEDKRQVILSRLAARENECEEARLRLQVQDAVVEKRLEARKLEQRRVVERRLASARRTRQRVIKRQHQKEQIERERDRAMRADLERREDAVHHAQQDVSDTRAKATKQRDSVAARRLASRNTEEAQKRQRALDKMAKQQARVEQMREARDEHDLTVQKKLKDHLRFRADVADLVYKATTSRPFGPSGREKLLLIRSRQQGNLEFSGPQSRTAKPVREGASVVRAGPVAGGGDCESPPIVQPKAYGRPKSARRASETPRVQLEQSKPCGLCRVSMLTSNLPGTVTKQSVARVRRSWGCDESALKKLWGVVETPLCGGAQYDTVRVCLFCAQFFDDIVHQRVRHRPRSEDGTPRASPHRPRMTEHARKVRDYSQMDKMSKSNRRESTSPAAQAFIRTQELRSQQQYNMVTRDIQASIKFCVNG